MNTSNNMLQQLGQLAREYDRKFRELEEFANTAQSQALLTQVKALGERTTDRFRTTQQALLMFLAQDEKVDQQQSIEALMALSSCFDEMRILLQIILQRWDSDPR